MQPAQSKSSTPHNKIYYFVTYGTAFIALGLTAAALGPMLPYLANHVNVSFSQISFTFTAISVGYLLGSAGGGQLFDRFKGHILLTIALIIMVAMLVLLPLTTQIYILLAILFLLGLGQGVLDVGMNVNLLWVYQARVGPYMNALHFFFGVGAFLAPIILHQVMSWTNGQLTWPFWSLAVIALPGLLGLSLLPSPKNPEKEVPAAASGRTEIGLLIAIVIMFFLYVGIETGFGGWIFSYVTELNIASEASGAYITSVFWGALTLGRLLSVPLARKIKPSHLLTGNFVIAIFFLGLILIFPFSPWAVWTSSAGLGLALSSVFPTLMVLGESRLRITGKITGFFFLGSSLGGTLIPMVLGQIFEFIGGYQVMLTLFSLTVFGLGVLYLLSSASKNSKEKVRI